MSDNTYIQVVLDSKKRRSFYVPDYASEISVSELARTTSFNGSVRRYSRLFGDYTNCSVKIYTSSSWSGYAILKSDWERINDK